MPNLVNVTINGEQIAVPRTATVLEAAREVGIDIPTLCDHPHLRPMGACRICLVEIEGQRTLQPACTFPVSEGIVVHTESDAAITSRKFILQLLLSERNHFCMYCQLSGDCELQDLAYRYGLDSWLYPRPYTPMPVDASRKYFVMDHNRCILCRKCVRACHELVGNSTLGLGNRGAKSMIVADMDVPFGDSSCISCGTCLQVCPTGSLMDRRSAYRGVEKDVERIKSACAECGVGCGIELVVRNNQLLRIEGDWDAEPNHGIMCVTGRFEPLYEERKRITSPMIRKDGALRVATWDEAVDAAATKLASLGGDAVAFVASARATNEALAGLAKVADKLGSQKLGSVSPSAAFLGQEQGSVSALDAADLFIVVGEDLPADYPVVSMMVKRGLATRETSLILVAEGENGLSNDAQEEFGPDQVEQVIALAQAASAPAVIYGAGMKDVVAALRRALGDKAQYLGLASASNSRGALAAGFDGCVASQAVKAVYAFVLDDQVSPALVDELSGVGFVVAQAAYQSPLVERADVVLPATIWVERSGTITNTEGRTQTVRAGLKPPAQVKSDQQVLDLVASRL